MEALLLSERIRNAILIGESDFREFKSAWEDKPGALRFTLTFFKKTNSPNA